MNYKINVKKLISGDRRTLAKAITLIESSLAEDRQEAQVLLQKILPYTGKSLRLGITGVPGVGKSTFIENFGCLILSKGHKIAVLAIDPSSPVSGGSILGDKTRMNNLSQQQNAFIRPSPSQGFLGGVAQKTHETILLCEAAGFDFIIIETVGVGQSEFEVADMVDFFLLLMLPNAGDELQGIKKGILELVDSVIINKADGDILPQALQTKTQYSSALALMSSKSSWRTTVMHCSALENKNLDAIYDMIENFKKIMIENGELENKRTLQSRTWFKKLVQELINLRLSKNVELNNLKEKMEEDISLGKILPLNAANEYVDSIFKHDN